jgi:hypothetical protein
VCRTAPLHIPSVKLAEFHRNGHAWTGRTDVSFFIWRSRPGTSLTILPQAKQDIPWSKFLDNFKARAVIAAHSMSPLLVGQAFAYALHVATLSRVYAAAAPKGHVTVYRDTSLTSIRTFSRVCRVPKYHANAIGDFRAERGALISPRLIKLIL